METHEHWERLYQTKSPEQTSWYQPHLETSLEWIFRAAPDRSSAIIDIGAGESTLVDDLLATFCAKITVLDISETALQLSKIRLGSLAQRVQWIAGNVLHVSLPNRAYDLWHDRAAFHFLTEEMDRKLYLRQLESTLKTGGHAVLATFGPDGPERCSGLPTMRYNAELLQCELGPAFRLTRHSLLEHKTPSGKIQQFLYSDFQLV
jgi:ubiquinone/menaquinone biosynthesis C-methylase UbiE